MGTIKVLDRLLSDMIAAGEVVERPASVVKELFENAKDAGAGRVTVEIQNGGKTLISVTDDGCGMDREDAVLSVVRYATSKLQKKEDLFSIATMGFRGEALASICAVSRVTIITRKEESLSGTQVICEGGEVLSVEEIGCPVGTKITVENLFFNTPARLKFMKKDTTEGAYIEEIMGRLILSNPHISIKFIKDNRQVYYSKGDNDIRSAIYAVYGNQLSEQLIAVNREIGGVKVSGFVGSPNLARSTRKFEHFSVNGRICKAKILFTALEYAYFQKMAQGKYPFCVLDITLDYSLCDVNVHPQKAEVKFADEAGIYDAVLTSVKDALEEKLFVKKPDSVPIATSKAVQFEEKSYQQSSFLKDQPKQEAKKPEPIFNTVTEYTFLRETDQPESVADSSQSESTVEKNKEHVMPETTVSIPTDVISPENLEEESEPEVTEAFRVIGQVFSSYILIEQGDELLLLDQHAAHERLNYEKIYEAYQKKEIHSQLLMAPRIVELAPTDYRLALEHLELFSQVGIVADDFQDNSIVIREIPCEVKERNIEKLVYEMIEEIRRSGKVLPEQFNQKILFLVACKMSVKANTQLSALQMEELVKEAFSLNGKTTCPHGRPLFVAFSKTYIETKFER